MASASRSAAVTGEPSLLASVSVPSSKCLMMHAPAAGRAIAELITRGRFETIDLSRLGYERVEANAPYAEVGIL